MINHELKNARPYAREDVTPDERETTRRMVGMLLSILADEPPQDAGGHPSPLVHVQAGAAWADWDKRRRAWETLLAPRLLREAMDDFRGGPHARSFRPAASDQEAGCAYFPSCSRNCDPPCSIRPGGDPDA